MIETFTEPKTCRIRKQYKNAGRKGMLYGIMNLDIKWGIVLWDGEEDPDFFKAAGLEVKRDIWSNVI